MNVQCTIHNITPPVSANQNAEELSVVVVVVVPDGTNDNAIWRYMVIGAEF